MKRSSLLFYLIIGTLSIFTLVSCKKSDASTKTKDENVVELDNDLDNHNHQHGDYNEGVVLVKTDNFSKELFGTLEYESVEPLFNGSSWYEVKLKEGASTIDSVEYLEGLDSFDKVDYDYIMQSAVEIDSIDISGNPYSVEETFLDTQCISSCWGYQKEHSMSPGGSPDVIVAVIDTGVDYNHLDLRNNIWINTGEIPNNGIDDDGNGYIDDVRGWDCVNEDNDPIDDNGHGTHVAGIIAAENNYIGTVGVAYNCKIMPIKAGNSSGYFSNSDIAQAVQYAYMNGASVINMSFGGSSISRAVEDALESAYNQCVLVAAAGNNGLCNQPGCSYCEPNVMPCYPGCLPYVVGVMSCNSDGTYISGFSNYDHAPYHYNKYEYDCYACGEQIISTWPNNKYCKLSGTSMASPVVAGIAALLRSAYPDRDTYSNKFIHSQLTNTGTKKPITRIGDGFMQDEYHPVCDAYEALTNIPKPHIYNLYNYYAFDNVELSDNNNGDGLINAGETIRLGIELQNRGGKATNVRASINTIRNNDPDLTDPNIEILNDTIDFDEIGTYSIQDGGKVYAGDKVIDMENAFLVRINPNTQHGYICTINLHLEYYNGLENDGIMYYGDCSFTIIVNNGYRISGAISEDTTFSGDKKYIVDDRVTIASNATIIFEAGSIIQFYDYDNGYINTTYNTPGFDVYGSLVFNGTVDNKIELTVSELWDTYSYSFCTKSTDAVIELNYCVAKNLSFYGSYDKVYINNSFLTYDATNGIMHQLQDGAEIWAGSLSLYNLSNCTIDLTSFAFPDVYVYNMCNSYVILGTTSSNWSPSNGELWLYGNINNNVFLDKKVLYFRMKIVVYLENCSFSNNAVLTAKAVNQLSSLVGFCIKGNTIDPIGDSNLFSDIYREYSSKLIANNVLPDGNLVINPNEEENYVCDLLWPYINDISIYNNLEEKVNTIGVEENTVRVTFSKNMDITNKFSLFYGSWAPYADYEIRGDYISETVWEGTIKVKANIEGGIQYFSSKGGCEKNNSFHALYDNSGAFTFNIDTSSAYAMNLQAEALDDSINLTWVQDDYETLMGYNIYRSTDKDGNYVRLNTSVISPDENTFIDDNAEPGMTYWYTFTVVLSDMSESNPAGKVMCTAKDTIAPNIYHTPANQGYLNNNLVIYCTASDNVSVKSVILYYRTIGEDTWKSIVMLKQNNRYSATIFGSELSLDGLEYYIVASDEFNSISKGTEASPYQVVIKDSSSISRIGDVDGDGIITTKDALMIMQSINGDLLLTNDQFIRADLNNDGILSSVEALRILQYINGNVNTLEM